MPVCSRGVGRASWVGRGSQTVQRAKEGGRVPPCALCWALPGHLWKEDLPPRVFLAPCRACPRGPLPRPCDSVPVFTRLMFSSSSQVHITCCKLPVLAGVWWCRAPERAGVPLRRVMGPRAGASPRPPPESSQLGGSGDIFNLALRQLHPLGNAGSNCPHLPEGSSQEARDLAGLRCICC